ncbi:MAG: SMC-Scp complex subunit ScpB [Terriglobia bacterium]
MLSDEALKATIEGIIYVAPEPVTLETIAKSLDGEERERVRAALEGLVSEYERPEHGISIRQVAGGYKFSSKAEHHETLRRFVKNLKPPVRLSKPALETLAVIAYRQPVTLPEIEEIRGVDCGGVTHTLMEKKLVVTAGRKNVVGRPILYRTSRDFLVHFGLKDVGELPSLKEFEELARQALGAPLPGEEDQARDGEATSVEENSIGKEPNASSAPVEEESPQLADFTEESAREGSPAGEGATDPTDEEPNQTDHRM